MTITAASQNLAALCEAGAQNIAIRIVAETGSTNADLLAEVARLDGPTLLWAESQTAGKGRAGRQWHSAAEATLTFSLAWKFSLPPQALAGLSLAVGVVVAQALASFGVDARLKWPNDVLKDGAKLAGILIETAVDKADRSAIWTIIGVGINLAHAQQLSQQIGRAVADAPELLVQREQLMAALLNRFSVALPVFEKNGFRKFAAAWNALDAYAGKAVNILDQGKILYQGHAAGADEEGQLLLDTAQGIRAIVAGDVSLRITE
jgi:BirA family biotin operon repressor/biotin-[acetyl-CoA-carboxylase] ligase